MKATKWQARTRQELIIEVWEALDCESVGERELLAIQNVLSETFGGGAVVSPATIARELVDEGAVLRHPEVLQCDTRWREQQFLELFGEGGIDFANLEAAASSLTVVDSMRVSAEQQGDQLKLKRIRDRVNHLRQNAELVSRSKIVSETERSVAKEIAQWLAVWLEQPNLFSEWLNLRQRSPEYQQKFGKTNC